MIDNNESVDTVNDTESNKSEKFKKIAQQRTRTIIKTLKLLGNCSNTRHYDYTEEDVRKIFSAIDKELKFTKNKFYDSLSDSEEEFTL